MSHIEPDGHIAADAEAETVSLDSDAEAPATGPDAVLAAPAEGVHGSKRRSQWLSTQRGRAEVDEAADEPGPGVVAGSTTGRARFIVPLLAVVAVLIVVAVLAGGLGSSQTSASLASGPSNSPRPDSRSFRATRSPAAPAPALSALAPTSAARPKTSAPTTTTATTATTTRPTAAAATTAASQAATTGLLGFWPLDQGSGTTAVDSVAGQPNGAMTNLTWQGTAADFDGTNSEITMPGPIVSTGPGDSFTVTASVYLTNTSTFDTVLSEDGANNSAFYLEYDSTDNRWAFARRNIDAANSTVYRALSSTVPVEHTGRRAVL